MEVKKFSKKRDSFFNKGNKKTQVHKHESNTNSDDFFVKSTSTLKNPSTDSLKRKTFNKVKWRSQKYSIKSKIENWQNKRADYIRHTYSKEKNRLKNSNFDVKKIYDEEEKRENELERDDDEVSRRKSKRKKFVESVAKNKLEKEEREEEFRKIKAQKEEALERYRKNKVEKNKKLNKKTKKGQPVMKGRIELLLEQIQKTVQS